MVGSRAFIRALALPQPLLPPVDFCSPCLALRMLSGLALLADLYEAFCVLPLVDFAALSEVFELGD